MNNKTILRLANVSFGYHRELALDKVNLEIKEGDFMGIIGPNGSGKTTLLRIILGLIKPKSGKVFRSWQKIGYVPQKTASLRTNFPITVEEIVSMGRISPFKFFLGFSQKDKTAVHKALESVGMEKCKKNLVNELSGGQQQRVFIARALAREPDLLLLDEPTVGVDIKAQEEFYDFLQKLNQELKLTLILVSHDIDAIAKEVKTLVCLNRKLIFHGSPKDFIKKDYLAKLYGKNIRFVLHNHA